jgi:hypothetical protein
MLGSFRTPAELAYRRLRMLGQRRDLLLDLFARRLRTCPARSGPPASAARHGAGTGIVVDRQLKRGTLKRRLGGPFLPSQPLDGQVRQE